MIPRAEAEAVVNSLFELLESQGQSDYIGEQISQLQHLLQTAFFAKNAGASPVTVVAALLHDVGQFLPSSAGELLYEGKSVGRIGHEKLGEDWLKSQGFGQEVGRLVGSHVVAKRYLTSTAKTSPAEISASEFYFDQLSEASKQSLTLQGGPFTAQEVIEFLRDPLWKEKVELRRWDDQAKVVSLLTPGLDSYRELVIDVLMM